MLLTLDDKKFQFIYEGFMIGGALVQSGKNMNVMRREIKILDKLEAISKECECGRKLPTGDNARELIDKQANIELNINLEEFDLIKAYMELVPWKTGIIRDAYAVVEWLVQESRN